MEEIFISISKMLSKKTIDPRTAEKLCISEINKNIKKLENINNEVKSNIRIISAQNAAIKLIAKLAILGFIVAILTGPISLGFSVLVFLFWIYLAINYGKVCNIIESARSDKDRLEDEHEDLRVTIENFQDKCAEIFDDWQEIEIPYVFVESPKSPGIENGMAESLNQNNTGRQIEKLSKHTTAPANSYKNNKQKFSLYEFLSIDVNSTTHEVHEAIKKMESTLDNGSMNADSRGYANTLLTHAKSHLLDPHKREEYNRSLTKKDL